MKNRKYRLVQVLEVLIVVLKLLKVTLELLNLAFNYQRKEASADVDSPVLGFPLRT